MTLRHFKNFLLLSHTGSSPKADAARWGYRGRRGVMDEGLPKWLFLPWWCWVGFLQTGRDGPATQRSQEHELHTTTAIPANYMCTSTLFHAE